MVPVADTYLSEATTEVCSGWRLSLRDLLKLNSVLPTLKEFNFLVKLCCRPGTQKTVLPPFSFLWQCFLRT